MVRSFILNDAQRGMVEDYLATRPSAMSAQIRQIRFRAKNLDFEVMESDMELLRRLAALIVPQGRKSLDLRASFTVVQPGSENMKASFKVQKET